MLDQIIQLVKDNAGSAIINNKAIPDAQNGEAIKTVAESVMNGLQEQASQGNIAQLTSLFQGGNIASSPIVGQLISSAASALASKFGISAQTAQGIASSILPMVMNQLVNKTNDPNDSSFDLGGIMKSLTGNGNFDIGSILGGKSGSDIGGMLGGLFK